MAREELFCFVCYESNMTSINHNTWWVGYGTSIHVGTTIQCLKNLRKQTESEHCIYILEARWAHMWRLLGDAI